MAQQHKITAFFSKSNNNSGSKEAEIVPSSSTSGSSKIEDNTTIKRRLKIEENGVVVKKFILPPDVNVIDLNSLEESHSQEDQIEPPPSAQVRRQKGSYLTSIFQALKVHLAFTGSFQEMLRSAEYDGLMKKWGQYADFPINIPHPPDGPLSEQIPLVAQFRNSILFYGTKSKDGGTKQNLYHHKCEVKDCLYNKSIHGLCESHNAVVFGIIQDIANKEECVLAFFCPNRRANGKVWDDAKIKHMLSKTHENLFVDIRKYMKKRADLGMKIKWKTLHRWSKDIPLKDTIKTALSLMVSFHNTKQSNEITLLNTDVIFQSADMQMVSKILHQNGLRFIVGNSDHSLDIKRSPYVNKETYRSYLPRTYVSIDENAIYDGVVFSCKSSTTSHGSIGHRIAKNTALTNTDENLIFPVFQTVLTAHELKLAAKFSSKTKKDWTEDDKEFIKKMTDNAKIRESIGHISTLVGVMSKCQINGKEVLAKATKFAHVDTNFDLEFFGDLCKMKFRREIVIEMEELAIVKKGKVELNFVGV